MTVSVLDRLVEILERVGRQTSPDQESPVAVLWPDPERQFAGIVPRLRTRLPFVTLGQYDAQHGRGPGIWIRCVLAGLVDVADGVPGSPLYIYLPGTSRDELREIAQAPPDVQAIADLQFRGTIWLQRSGREWTGPALMGADAGMDLKISRDSATSDAFLRALPILLDESLTTLQGRGHLNAQFFNELLAPDPEQLLLLWINDPITTKASADSARWSAFLGTCRATYGFDPETDGALTAALRLGERKGEWAKVWSRFVDTPERYPALPDQLRAVQPQSLMPEPPDAWPGVNEQGEDSLRQSLTSVSSMTPVEALNRLQKLESDHGWRRATVWAKLGQAPLAGALVDVVDLAKRCLEPLGGMTAIEIAKAYAATGWMTDSAAIKALSAVPPGPDLEAVGLAVRAVYESWLDNAARALQTTFAEAIPDAVFDEYEPGTCLLFIDGLRFDVAEMIRERLSDSAVCTLDWRFAAVPTVTPTAKPAVTPLAGAFFPGPGLAPSLKKDGTALAVSGLRKALTEGGWEVLGDGKWGDPNGRAWLEGGDIDAQGHSIPQKLPHRLQAEAIQVVDLVTDLLQWGWKWVVVVTDHGWLHLPGGLPKVELPLSATETRKGRCARIADGASTDQPTLPWRWDSSVRIAVAPGIACYESGKVYEHGGISPQESVTPHLTIEAKAPRVAPVIANIRSVVWAGQRCRIEVEGAEGATADIRTKPADPSTSVVAETKMVSGGKCALMVPDDQLEGQIAAVVINDSSGVIIAQRPTTIADGGE